MNSRTKKLLEVMQSGIESYNNTPDPTFYGFWQPNQLGRKSLIMIEYINNEFKENSGEYQVILNRLKALLLLSAIFISNNTKLNTELFAQLLNCRADKIDKNNLDKLDSPINQIFSERQVQAAFNKTKSIFYTFEKHLHQMILALLSQEIFELNGKKSVINLVKDLEKGLNNTQLKDTKDLLKMLNETAKKMITSLELKEISLPAKKISRT